MSHLRNLQSNIKFKLAGEGFFFPISKGIKTLTDKKKKDAKPLTYPVVQAKAKAKQTFSTLGDMLLQKYTIDFISTLQGDKTVITGGELGEWRLTQYTSNLIYAKLSARPNNSPISIEHDCGPDPLVKDPQEKWVWAMTPGKDKRRRLCANCKKRVPENIRGLIKLIE